MSLFWAALVIIHIKIEASSVMVVNTTAYHAGVDGSFPIRGIQLSKKRGVSPPPLIGEDLILCEVP